MLLTATTDTLEIILDKAITTSELNFAVFYSDYTSTSVTPTKNFGVTNSTTAVSLIPAPTSSNQRQLRWCSVSNTDTVDIGVKIRFNDNGSFRTILYVYLRVGESIQYSEEMGWRVYTLNGEEKISGYIGIQPSVKFSSSIPVGSTAASVTLVNTNSLCQYLGKTERAYNTINVQYRLVASFTGAVSWAEIAIYKGNPSLSVGTTMTRMGFLNVATAWATTGVKTAAIPVTNCAIGDEIFVVFSNSAATSPASIGTGNIADLLGSGILQSVTNTRPSTSSSITGVVDSTTAMLWVAWQGV